MTQSNILPGSRAALVNPDGSANNVYYKFFLSLTNQVINVVSTVKGKADASIIIKGAGSITGGGDLTQNRTMTLVGDNANPPNLSFYGVLNNGKGWQNLSNNFQVDSSYLYSALDLSDTGITAGSYGDATHIPIPTVDAKGRIRAIDLVPIASGSSLNYLVNGWLQNWQHGTSLTGTGYLADCFSTFTVGATCTTTRVSVTPGTFSGDPDFCAQFVVGSGTDDTDFCQFLQAIEDCRTLAGKTAYLTFQVIASAASQIAVDLVQYLGDTSGVIRGIGATKIDLVEGLNTINIPVSIPEISFPLGTAKTDYLGVVIWFDAGDYYASRTQSLGHQSGTFQLGTLSLGENAPSSFSRPDQSAELERCNRFFRKSFPHSTTPAQNAGTTGCVYVPQVVSASTLSAVTHVTFGNFMRVAPVVTLYNPSASNNQVHNDTLGSDWSLSAAGYVGDTGFGVRATSASGSAAGNAATFHWTADASYTAGAPPVFNTAYVLSPDGVQGFITETGAILIP